MATLKKFVEVIEKLSAAEWSWPEFCCLGLVRDAAQALGVEWDWGKWEKLSELSAVTKARRENFSVGEAWCEALKDGFTRQEYPKFEPGNILILNPGIYESGDQRYLTGLDCVPALVAPDHKLYAWLARRCLPVNFRREGSSMVYAVLAKRENA